MGEIIAWLAGWWNWPFLLPLAIGVLFVLADLLLGGVSDMLGLDADAQVDVDVPIPDGDAVDLAAAHFGDGLKGLLSWVGIGKVPISVLIEVMCISFGSVGLLVNAVAADLVPGGSPFAFPLALVAATLAAPVITRAVGGTVARLVPGDASTTEPPEAFIGQLGVTASRVGATIGQVRIEASEARPQTLLNARCAPDAAGEIPRGQSVLLVGYDRGRNVYTVAPVDLEV